MVFQVVYSRWTDWAAPAFAIVVLTAALIWLYGLAWYNVGRSYGAKGKRPLLRAAFQTIFVIAFVVVIVVASRRFLIEPAAFCKDAVVVNAPVGFILNAFLFLAPIALVLAYTFRTEGSGWRKSKPQSTAVLKYSRFWGMTCLVSALLGALFFASIVLANGGIPSVLCH